MLVVDTNGFFHIQDGLYVRRVGEEGTVEVMIVQEEPEQPGRVAQTRQIFRTRIPSSGWASMMAHASRRGETSDTWDEALEFHNKRK